MKKLAMLLLSAILLTSVLGLSSFATTDSQVQPRWTNTGTINYGLVFEDSGYGSAEIAVTGKFGVNKIEGSTTIYRQSGSNWIYVTSGSDVMYDQVFELSVPVNGILGEYYKAEFTINVYKNGVCETITRTSYANCP